MGVSLILALCGHCGSRYPDANNDRVSLFVWHTLQGFATQGYGIGGISGCVDGNLTGTPKILVPFKGGRVRVRCDPLVSGGYRQPSFPLLKAQLPTVRALTNEKTVGRDAIWPGCCLTSLGYGGRRL